MRDSFTCLRDNLTIRGHVYRCSTERIPAVILSHGFLACDRSTRVYAETLASIGYAAFTYDFNGGGIRTRSDGKSVDMTVFTELEDLRAVMDYVKGLENVDADRISLLGCSQGGLVSAMTAKRYPEEVEKLILFYPALCIPDDARAGHMMFFRFDPKDIPPVLGRFPMKLGGEYARTVIDLDVFQQIGGYDGPVMLIHGTKDKIVNISYSEKAKTLYPNCSYHVVENGTHGFKGKCDREAIEVLKKFMQFN